MPDGTALTPLRPREFFAVPWSGEGEWIARGWVRWLPGRAHRFRFSSYTTWLNDEVWLVHETTTWEDGRFERRAFAKNSAPRHQLAEQAGTSDIAPAASVTFGNLIAFFG